MKKKKISNQDPNKKKKSKKKRIIWICIFLVCLCAAGFYIFKIFDWGQDNKKIDDLNKEIDEIVEMEEVPDSEEQEAVNPPESTNKSDDYWDYIKLPLLSVDFTELLKKNADTVAFLKVNGTTINYPVVQTTNNDYYLTHAFNKQNNGAGWIFLDYRNNINNLDDNTIIYGHGRLNTTMFGSLKNIVKNNWYENTDNYVLNLSTPEENTLWQVFSIYHIPTETYYLTSNFGTEESHQNFINTIVGRSIYDFKTSVNTSDKILTLSTCYNDSERVVLHAKLIKKQAR